MKETFLLKAENAAEELINTVCEKECKKYMEFRKHRKDGFIMIYGFKTDDRYFDVVMTLCKSGNETRIYGFCSRVELRLGDYAALWNFLKKNVETELLVMETLPEHARIYKCFLPVINSKRTITFDEMESETLTVKVR
ncbi:MAG: hypothetical protein ABID09_04105 [Candidatus Omnitrophota bacterium]